MTQSQRRSRDGLSLNRTERCVQAAQTATPRAWCERARLRMWWFFLDSLWYTVTTATCEEEAQNDGAEISSYVNGINPLAVLD